MAFRKYIEWLWENLRLDTPSKFGFSVIMLWCFRSQTYKNDNGSSEMSSRTNILSI